MTVPPVILSEAQRSRRISVRLVSPSNHRTAAPRARSAALPGLTPPNSRTSVCLPGACRGLARARCADYGHPFTVTFNVAHTMGLTVRLFGRITNPKFAEQHNMPSTHFYGTLARSARQFWRTEQHNMPCRALKGTSRRSAIFGLAIEVKKSTSPQQESALFRIGSVVRQAHQPNRQVHQTNR